jgi:ATP-dependent RNA helicase DOB1
MLMERNYDPVIIFSFSKRECETLSLQMNKLDLTGPDEKKVVDTIFTNAMDALNDDDKRLPQVVHMLPLLRRGIGVHHSGLLPIIKEARRVCREE